MALRPDNYSSQPPNIGYYPKYHWKLITLTVLGAIAVAVVAVVVGLTPVYIGRTANPVRITNNLRAQLISSSRAIDENRTNSINNTLKASFKINLNAYESNIETISDEELTATIEWLTLASYNDLQTKYYTKIKTLIDNSLAEDNLKVSQLISIVTINNLATAVPKTTGKRDDKLNALITNVKTEVQKINGTTVDSAEWIKDGDNYKLKLTFSVAQVLDAAGIKSKLAPVLTAAKTALKDTDEFTVTTSDENQLSGEATSNDWSTGATIVYSIIEGVVSLKGTTTVTLNNLATAVPIKPAPRNEKLNALIPEVKKEVEKLGVTVNSGEWIKEGDNYKLKLTFSVAQVLDDAGIKSKLGQVVAAAKTALKDTDDFKVTAVEENQLSGEATSTVSSTGSKIDFSIIGGVVSLKGTTTVTLNNLATAVPIKPALRNEKLNALIPEVKKEVEKLGVKVDSGESTFTKNGDNFNLKFTFSVAQILDAAGIKSKLAQVVAAAKTALKDTDDFKVTAVEENQLSGEATSTASSTGSKIDFSIIGGVVSLKGTTEVTLNNLATAVPIKPAQRNEKLDALIADVQKAVNTVEGVTAGSGEWTKDGDNYKLKLTFSVAQILNSAGIKSKLGQVLAAAKTALKSTDEFNVTPAEENQLSGEALSTTSSPKATTAYSIIGGVVSLKGTTEVTLNNLATAVPIKPALRIEKLKALIPEVKKEVEKLGVTVDLGEWIKDGDNYKLKLTFSVAQILDDAGIKSKLGQVVAAAKTALKDTDEFTVTTSEEDKLTGEATSTTSSPVVITAFSITEGVVTPKSKKNRNNN